MHTRGEDVELRLAAGHQVLGPGDGAEGAEEAEAGGDDKGQVEGDAVAAGGQAVTELVRAFWGWRARGGCRVGRGEGNTQSAGEMCGAKQGSSQATAYGTSYPI